MGIKKDWEVAKIPLNALNGKNEFAYQLYRIKDESKPDYTGNREWGAVFDTEKEAEKEAAKLNKKYKTYVETQRSNVTPKEFWRHCDKLMKEYHSSMETTVGEYDHWINPPEDEIKFNNRKEWYSAEPYNFHDGIQGERSYIIEFDFDDEKRGHGYFYATDPDITIAGFIRNQNYSDAYKEYRKHTTSFDENFNYELNFMKDVVKICGADIEKIKSAIEAVAKSENKTPKFMAKLLNETTQLDEYQNALGKGQEIGNEKQNATQK